MTLNKNLAVLALCYSTLFMSSAQAQVPQAAANTMQTPARHSLDLSVYPKVTPDLNRHVIWLDPQANEQRLKVEIIATKQHMKDCNQGSFRADLSIKYVQNGSRTYYQVGPADRYISTVKGCPHVRYLGDSPVRFTGESMLSYHSHAPIIVYAPQDIQVSYRIWQIASTHPTQIENQSKVIQPDQ